jgi:hypothetical protein
MDGIQILGNTGYKRIDNISNEDSIKQAVRQIGPVTVTFSVNNDFLLYIDGVYQGNS